jgi:hypothetical protein
LQWSRQSAAFPEALRDSAHAGLNAALLIAEAKSDALRSRIERHLKKMGTETPALNVKAVRPNR